MARSMFNLSSEHKLSTDMGLLVPVCTEEVLPGDTFIHSSSALARVAPLVNPVMHRCDMRIHHFFVPNRLLWDGWEGFITGRDDTTVPTVDPVAGGSFDLTDHMGVDREYTGLVNCLPIRAYNMIWNEFYRDQDLQAERAEDAVTLARCCWEKDYLTVARPSPQQGDAQTIPLGAGEGQLKGLYRGASGTPSEGTITPIGDTAGGNIAAADAQFIYKHNATPVTIDFSTASGGIDINDLRRSMALQRFAEARAMFGERYIDYLRFLGVNPSDGRLSRPEYLGGGRQVINFSEVLATAEGATSEVGDMYGHGIVATRSRRYRKMFEEHGWVMSLLSVRPKTVYQDGVPRKFTRLDAMDYWQKELEVLPWQEVKTLEVHYQGNLTDVFGYAPRYEEYRASQSFVSGSFRKGTEEDWHFARSFASLPTLNGSFVECTPTDRVYSDTNMPELLINVRNSILAKRLVRGTAQLGAL